MERKLDAVIAGSAPIQDLALAIGQDRILLPLAVIVSRTLNDEGDEVATAIRVGRLTFTLEEAVRLGVLTPEGRFSHYRAAVLLHSTPEPGTWVRPHREAEIPGKAPRIATTPTPPNRKDHFSGHQQTRNHPTRYPPDPARRCSCTARKPHKDRDR